MNPQLFDIPAVWLGVGLLGQALFSLLVYAIHSCVARVGGPPVDAPIPAQ